MTAQKLKHFPNRILERWNGGNVKLWAYSVTHRSLTLRIERPGIEGNLHIYCSADHIRCPTSWNKSDITIERLESSSEYIIRDDPAGVEIRGACVELRENVPPVYIGVDFDSVV